jgi:hypothetical protein
MAQAFNFETRQLSPYIDNWLRDDGLKLSGTLWYLKEEDGIYIIIENDKSSELPKAPMDRVCVAKGLPAALLAQGEALVDPNFDFDACYQAYFKIAKEHFPTKPAYHIPTILNDWSATLCWSPIDRTVSEYIDKYALMTVACFIREISNPYHTDSLVEKISHSYYYTSRFKGSARPKLIFSQMPSIDSRIEAPMIYTSGLNRSFQTMVLQADGFIAAVFNLALFYHWQRRWSELDFTQKGVVEKVIKAYKKHEPIEDLTNLHFLVLSLPDEVEDICKAYMEAFEPIMQKLWKINPNVQLECTEGDNIYSYIYMHEASSSQRLIKSELYENLSDGQKRTLIAYYRRFMEWLPKNYPITTATHHSVMRAMSKDMPPIQISFKNNIKITRAGEEVKPICKFKYIISDDEKEIKKIHDRIKLHLSTPSELRNELSDMQDEELISLPMDKPTEIIREVHRIWGDIAPKERSFVIAWVRRF